MVKANIDAGTRKKHLTDGGVKWRKGRENERGVEKRQSQTREAGSFEDNGGRVVFRDPGPRPVPTFREFAGIFGMHTGILHSPLETYEESPLTTTLAQATSPATPRSFIDTGAMTAPRGGVGRRRRGMRNGGVRMVPGRFRTFSQNSGFGVMVHTTMAHLSLAQLLAF